MASAAALDTPAKAPGPLKPTMGCLLGTMLGTHFLTVTAVGIVMTNMTGELHWSRGGISGAISLLLLVGALMTAVWGRVIDRVGVRSVAVIGTTCLGLIVMSLYWTNGSMTKFYITFGALGFVGATAVGYTKVISVLFTRNRGAALAVFGLESTLVGAVSPQIIYQLATHFGWRGMFLGLGLINLAVAASLVYLLDSPLVKVKPTVAGPSSDPARLPGVTSGVALRSKDFWLVNVASMTGNITATGLLPHLVPLALSRGLSPQAAVTALTVHTIAIPCGQFVGGVLLDRVNTARIAVPFAVLAMIGLLVLSAAHGGALGQVMLIGGVGLLGFGNGAKRGMNTYFFTRYYGLKSLAELAGLSIAISSVVLAPAPFVFGVIYDKTHSYDLALWILGGGLVIANILYLFVGPYRYAATIGAATPVEVINPIAEGAPG